MKSHQAKIIYSILLILFLVCQVSSCTKKTELEKIRIGILKGPSEISFIQLIDEKKELDGKEIEIIILDEPTQIQAKMMRNQLDFAILPTVMAANLYNKGIKYHMVGCPIWGTLYLVSKDENVRSFNDIHGKDIAVFGQGTTADVLTQYNMKQNGIVCNSIDYRFKTNHELAQALLMSEIKTCVLSEPLISIISEKDSTIRVIEKIKCKKYSDDSERSIFVQTAFLVSDHFIKDNPEAIGKVCDMYVNSCNSIYEKPEETAGLLVKHKLAPNINIAKKFINLCNIEYVAAFALSKELYAYLNIFYKENPESIGGKMPKQDFIYQTY